ncbi:MAG: TldD/PmbA family protein, partial [Williamsia herbipolensis]|nr:TldD/PmbA family protein [Williamsia herbipolensis]
MADNAVRTASGGPRQVDPEFLTLPLEVLADAALSAATAAGASFADFRCERLLTGSYVVKDTAVADAGDATAIGYAVRVLVDGVWGFSSGFVFTPETAREVAEQAVTVSRALAPIVAERVERADEPIHAGVTWISDYRIDPFEVPVADRLGVLVDASERLLAHDGVNHTSVNLLQVKENKFYADTAGTRTTQQRVRLHAEVEGIGVDADTGGFESMRSLAPPVGRGWEAVTDPAVWDLSGEIVTIAETLAEKRKAPSVTAGRYDLVIDPSNLWLTIHESIGHATEYDRAIGYEAAYAGTAFATPDNLNTLQYGSGVMNVTGDRTVPHGLATIGYDDDGVAGQQWDLISSGVLVGYQLDRVFARKLGLQRSNGCAFADSPAHIPIQRMANVSLQPDPQGGSTEELIADVENGIYVVGDKSWSIDQQR